MQLLLSRVWFTRSSFANKKVLLAGLRQDNSMSLDAFELMRNRENSEILSVFVVHAGEKTFPLEKRVEAIAAGRILEDGTRAESQPK